MWGRIPMPKSGPYQTTPFPYPRHQGTHSVDYVSPISLDLKNMVCQITCIKWLNKFLILHKITNGTNMTILKARFTIVAVSTSFCPSFFLSMWSRQLPLPSCQFWNGKGRCDFWKACTNLSHNVTFEGIVLVQKVSMINMVKLWKRSIPINKGSPEIQS